MIGHTLLNRYEITAHLGDGSTATVYRAKDLRLNRDVALKVLLPHVRDSTRKRFFQEATAAAQLNHPGIMAIYNMEQDYEQPFLVVEYVEGRPLSDFIPSAPAVVVELGTQIARALQYAHERDIIHRDIKPANIKVTPERAIKIMDLGLALPREAARVTAEGMVIGTPAYLSPEQAQGAVLDFRTDIYSLGVVLYEMACGQLPFDADDISALLLQQVRQPPPPPRLMMPSLPANLENVILKALEKSPARRFQSCRSMADALEDALSAPLTADAPTARRRPEGFDLTQRPALRLVLADDHNIMRRTLVSFLEGRAEFAVIGEAADGETALRQTLTLMPDVLLLDLNMPGKGGLDILPTIRQKAPGVKVLVLTGRDEEWYIVRALRAGAHGYVLKSTDENELIEAITKVMQGHMVLGSGVAERIVGGLIAGQEGQPAALTDLERRILLYVAAGHENEAIGRQLKIAMPIVIETLAGVMNKLGAKDRTSAALEALKRGDIQLDELHQL
jgi:serine/threonine protein kinase/DNA-binding CsgD family transcriptional regulator